MVLEEHHQPKVCPSIVCVCVLAHAHVVRCFWQCSPEMQHARWLVHCEDLRRTSAFVLHSTILLKAQGKTIAGKTLTFRAPHVAFGFRWQEGYVQQCHGDKHPDWHDWPELPQLWIRNRTRWQLWDSEEHPDWHDWPELPPLWIRNRTRWQLWDSEEHPDWHDWPELPPLWIRNQTRWHLWDSEEHPDWHDWPELPQLWIRNRTGSTMSLDL